MKLVLITGAALALCCAALSARSQPADPWSPAARAQAHWAQQQHLAGQPDTAAWLGKLALRAAPASHPDSAALAGQLAGWLADSGRWDEARELQGLAKSLGLAAFTGPPAVSHGASLAPSLDPTESVWTRSWPHDVPMQADSLAAAEQLQSLLALPRSRHVAKPPRPRAITGELQFHAISSESGLGLLLDGPQGVSVHRIDWPRPERERELGLLLGALARQHGAVASPAPSLLAMLQAAYRRIGAPLDRAAQAAGAQRVVLHVDGVLRELPWAALHDGVDYLGERYAFRVAAPPSNAAPIRGTGPLRLQALGLSQPQAGMPALPGVAQEVCAIVNGPVHGLVGPPHRAGACGQTQGAIDGEAWLDGAFTAQRLSTAVATASQGGRALLHLGTHFDLRPGRMERSSVLLGDGTRWPLARVGELDFSAYALVALAACETGSGGAGAAESLQALLINRGAQAVLASLWRVDDSSTSALMQAFYGHLAKVDPEQALRLAQKQVRSRPGWQAPFHWAGFVIAAGP